MAINDIMGLLGRAGEVIGGGTPGLYGGLLSEEELRQAKNKASTKALFDLSASLAEAARPRSGRPIGTFGAIAKGLSSAQEGYQGTLQQQAKEKLAMQEMQRQMQAKQRADQAQALGGRLFTQATPAQPAPYLAGAPYGKATPAQPGGINQEVFAKLLATPEGRDVAKQYTDLIPAARKAGMLGQASESDNPFNVFLSDPSLPTPVKNLASQLSSSFEKGLIDPDKVDERVRQLATMQQQALDRAATREQQEAMARLTASLRPEKLVTVMDEQGSPITVTQSQAANQPLYSPSAAKALKETKVKEESRKQLSDLVSDFGEKYKSLKEAGGIVSSKKDSLENVFARISSSDVGQFVGGALGSKAQTLRQELSQKRPLLLNLIKNATGMSSQQMNSNTEMQLYLSAATDPKLSFEANMAALEGLDKTFGLGLFKAEEEENPFGK